MLNIGQVLQNRYRIVRQLGHGGMGAVYEAIDERFGTPVALKEILIELTSSADEEKVDSMVKAFEREAKSLANARHEAVPFVRDYFSEINRQFLVMEMVEGDELADLLRNRKTPFPLEDALFWMDQLLDALDYLHTLKPPIFHRDIKPQNLKLNLRQKIKLLDFGIAKSADAASTITSQTFVGATLDYSPIEQILRAINPVFREFILLKHKEKAEEILAQSTDARCDIYSLGATFYHLLTNHLPVDIVKRTIEVWSNEGDSLINPSQLNPEIPQSIADCLVKAMAVERDNRFSSALEMREALRTAIIEERKTKEAKERQDEQRGNMLAAAQMEYLRLEQEEKRLQERISMQAQTEAFNLSDEIKFETVVESPSDASLFLTEPSFNQRPDTDSSVPKSSVTESSITTAADTQPSGSISKSDLSVTPYYEETPADKKKASLNFSLFSETKSESKSNGKLLWILPLAMLSVVLAGGIGGIVLFSGSDSTNSTNQSAANAVVSTPTVTPTVEPSVSPSIEPTPSPTANTPVKTDEKPKPAGVQTPNRTPIQNPVKTPPVKQKTPKPKPSQDPNCVFTNSCQ